MTTRDDTYREESDTSRAIRVSRRDAMKAAGTGAILGSFGATGVAGAVEGSTCSDEPALENCTFKHKYEENSLDSALTCDCDPLADPSGCLTYTNGEQCVYIVESALEFFDTTHVTLKTGRFCQVQAVSDSPLQTVSLSCGDVTVRKFCSEETSDGKVHDISHVELFGCPAADVSIDCPNDQAVIDVSNTDSVYWTVDYVHCDASDKDGTQTFPDTSGGTFTVPLADCEGTISVYTAEGGELLDSAHFDCETASVSVDCPNDVATVSAPDTSLVYYEIDYVHCDEADVSRTELDMSTTDTATVPVADCEGTITLTDDDGSVLDTATFDCETAAVSVDCPADTATISAPDTSEVWYSIDYDHCDEADVSRTRVDLGGSTDSATVPVANCEGTITVTDDDGNVLARAVFDCETASVSVDCPSSTATISASDTSEVWYEIDYVHCDESDVSRTMVDLSGSTDSVGVPIANCEGTITLTDDDGTVLDSATFDCETAFVAEVDCPNDVAVIHAEDTSTVDYAVDYEDCDEADASGTLDFSSTDDLTIPLANCEGTITLTDDDGRILDEVDFDCETAAVSVDCPSLTATISASDTTEVWYEIDYEHCDEPDVSRTGPLDLSGDIDSVDVPVAACEGTITVTDDDGTVFASADFDCETAFVAEVDCPNDVARIHAEDTSTVDYAVDYVHCDEADASGTLDFSGTDDLTIPLANCEGTITLTDDDGNVLDTADFDCETAQVSVDCPSLTATISAEDTDEVWYEIDYVHCDEADVSRTGPLDLSGDTDSVTVPVAACEGTITVTDDDGTVLATADFDCETAAVAEVNCPEDFARIHAEDTASVNYTVDYVNCDEPDASGTLDFTDTDDLTIPLANCEGTITLTDDEGRVLDTQTFDCETAQVAVDCPSNNATISASDTSTVWYEIDYEHCDEADVSLTEVDLGGSTDSATVPVASCEGTITVYDDDGIVLASADFDCETAAVAEVNCPEDFARIHAEDTSTVNYEVDYVHCDEADASGTLDFSSTDDLTIPLANCEGTITLTDDDGRVLDTEHFDCETASVSVDCPSNTATITASDTSEVWYEIDYQHCDEADVSRTGPLDLSGSTDSVTVPVASCEGTITLTDDDGIVLDSATFDCETAKVAEVDCPNDVAVITAEDTSTVNYTVDYVNCDEADASGTLDFSSTDELTIPLANCEGTITLTDDDGRVLDTASFDCETAQVSVDCPASTATISASDTSTVWYEIDYEHCDVADVSLTEVDLSGSTDSATVPVANCEGTITVYDDDDQVLASADFDCETATVSVECPTGSDHPVATISAEDTSTVDFSVDYDSTACTDESGSIDLSGSTDTVQLALQDCDGTITISDDDGIVLASTSFEACCPPCPDDLSVRFEENEIHEGSTESQTIGGTTYTFEITEVTTNDEGEPIGVCFVSNVDFCELEVGIQAGGGKEEDKVVVVEPNADGEYCFDVKELDHAISHFTIRCP